jgi:hypothetical protein
MKLSHDSPPKHMVTMRIICDTGQGEAQRSGAQHSTAQHTTPKQQHSTPQHSTAQDLIITNHSRQKVPLSMTTVDCVDDGNRQGLISRNCWQLFQMTASCVIVVQEQTLPSS